MPAPRMTTLRPRPEPCGSSNGSAAAGALSPSDYERFVLPYSQKLLTAAKQAGVPVIHFGTNTTTLLPLMKRAGGDVIGLDWRIPLDDGIRATAQWYRAQGWL